MAKSDGKASAGVVIPKVTKCELTRDQFAESAQAILVTLESDGLTPTTKQLILEPKNFSTGSFGWSCMDKLAYILNGKSVKVQVSMNLTVVGSKDAQ